MPLVLSVLLALLCSLYTASLSDAFEHNRNIERLHVKRNSTGLTDSVTWDPHSLSIEGQRVFILSAEFHPWRLPTPNLWADVFQKIRANGFNTVSFYVDWALHFPTPDTNNGTGDFQAGTYRDIQRFIDEAKAAGLWMIARLEHCSCLILCILTVSISSLRPGPYISAVYLS